MLSMNYIKEEQNYYEQKIKELIEKDEYNIRRNQRQQKEIERLNNIIEKLEKWLKEKQDLTCGCGITREYIYAFEDTLEYLQDLKEGNQDGY